MNNRLHPIRFAAVVCAITFVAEGVRRSTGAPLLVGVVVAFILGVIFSPLCFYRKEDADE